MTILTYGSFLPVDMNRATPSKLGETSQHTLVGRRSLMLVLVVLVVVLVVVVVVVVVEVMNLVGVIKKG